MFDYIFEMCLYDNYIIISQLYNLYKAEISNNNNYRN